MQLFKRHHIFLLVHLICWLILALGFLYSHPPEWGDNVPRAFWIRQNLLLAILITAFYLNYNLLIPSLLLRKQIGLYAIITITLIIGLTLLNDGVNKVFHLNQLPFPHHGPPHRINTFVPGMILLMIGLGITVSFIKQWQEEVTLRQQLEQEKVTTELTMLKAQINPHFFFNTLNTIYSYTLSDGDVARTAITNLSKMMRYVLYDAAGKQTPLSKEIAFIQEYVELMKLRTSRKTTVQLQIEEQAQEVMIAPMLFLPFVENAFKHGVSSIQESHIVIHITQHADRVILKVRNTIHQTRSNSEEQSNGIGIANTTRRLDLLYPDKYTLTTGLNNQQEYEVQLILQL
ncbi:histidine kinase [Mucilaginibacter robiniae]|uniref:Histidine kinase n=1 Tax=Mucilaginibacter robiniae TaxID=2728022 RepID=A0A7L5DZL2_9SPHI|nr:histidine kinase [Mucilaginibacter robiniae]QJD96221.1 histidine kinase [Mucilaginibacter robiniae]